jgi:hypothetical protein
MIQIQALLGRVPEWARAHPGAPCPDVAALEVPAVDPWGHRIELTCTDQPADQIMGATSIGPDGIAGNGDDVKSWNLGPTVTRLVQGRRWTPGLSSPEAPFATKPAPGKRRKDASLTGDRNSRAQRTSDATSTTATPAPPIDAGDGIPTRR